MEAFFDHSESGESFAEKLLGASGLLVVSFKREGSITFFNSECEELTGLSSEEARGKLLWDILIPEKFRRRVLKEIDRLQAGERATVFESALFTTMGEKVDIRWRNEAVRDESGEILLILGIGLDVTRLRKIQRNLLESEERYRSLFHSIGDVLIHTDPDRRIIDANETALKDIFGYTLEDIRGKTTSMLDASPKEDISPNGESHAPAKEPHRCKQVFLKKKNGEIFLAEITPVHVTNGKGEKIGYLGIMRDISERARMQEQFVLSEKLAALGMMISGAAHELNNPLTGILGFSEYLLSKKNEMSEAVLRDIQIIHGEAARAAQIVSKLLAFSRQKQPEKALVNMNWAIRSVLELRAFHLSQDGIEIVLDLAENIPSIVGDFQQLQQVALDILNNAHEAVRGTEGKGKIIIRSSYHSPFVRVEIQDNGPGIPENIKTRIFDPFFTTKPFGKGKGLGLSTAFGIVKEHGGSIKVESEPGKGATFIVDLPATQPDWAVSETL